MSGEKESYLKQNKTKKRLLFIVEEVDFYPSNICEEKNGLHGKLNGLMINPVAIVHEGGLIISGRGLPGV